MPPGSDALRAARIGSGDAHMEPSHPKAKAEKQALQGCDFHHPMWSGEAEMASSRCAFVSAPAVK